jgi:hypothetical protein
VPLCVAVPVTRSDCVCRGLFLQDQRSMGVEKSKRMGR